MMLLFLYCALLAVDEQPAAAAGDEPRTEAAMVPSVKGQTVAVADQLLHLTRLHAAHGTLFIAPKNWRDDILPGRVYMQSPQPGMLVPSGDTVACWTFAKATEDQPLIDMPDLRGLSPAEAQRKLTDAGLVPMPPAAQGTDDAGAEGSAKVADHYPRAGQRVYQGTSVYLLLGA